MYAPLSLFRRRVAVRRVCCTVCNQEKLATGIWSLLFLHIFHVPVFPVGRSIEWVCLTCDKPVDANRPSLHPVRPAISGCGLAAAWLLILMGTLGVAVMHFTKRGDIGPPAIILLSGLAFIVTLLRQRRNARRSGFEALAAAAVPLHGDHCPLCAVKLSASKPSRCPHCDVEVITG